MLTISLEAVVQFHHRAIRRSGGLPGVRDAGALASAVQRPQAGFGDVEFFATVFLKAAAIAHEIVSSHPFVDGNKRTALLAAGATLRLNGFEPDSSTEDEVRTMLALANGDRSLEQFAAWLEEHSFPLTAEPETNGSSP